MDCSLGVVLTFVHRNSLLTHPFRYLTYRPLTLRRSYLKYFPVGNLHSRCNIHCVWNICYEFFSSDESTTLGSLIIKKNINHKSETLTYVILCLIWPERHPLWTENKFSSRNPNDGRENCHFQTEFQVRPEDKIISSWDP